MDFIYAQFDSIGLFFFFFFFIYILTKCVTAH